MVQEFDLLPRTLRPIHWINVEKFLGAAGFNGSAGNRRLSSFSAERIGEN
jgi:hypothetical protein